MKARICKEKHWNVHLRFFLVMMGDLLFSVSVLAQSNLITGKVIDNASEPIIGASIQSSVVGKGTISNMNGDFSIEVPVGTELTISFLGYRTQKIKVSDMRSLVIKLLEDTQALDETKNNYIMCIVYIADRYGLSIADISTGDYFVTELPDSGKLLDEICKFMPSEIICNESFYMSGMDLEDLRQRLGITIYALDSWYFDDAICKKKLLEHFKVSSFAGLGLMDYDCGIISAGALLQYLLENTEKILCPI